MSQRRREVSRFNGSEMNPHRSMPTIHLLLEMENHAPALKYQQEQSSVESLTKSLDFSECNLITVPRAVIRYTALYEIRLSNNDIELIPECLFLLQTLRRIHLDHNKILSLPQQLTGWSKIEELYLNNNLLLTLPPSISHLSSVRVLNLSHNALKELPHEISLLRRLEKLELSHNTLKSIPDSLAALSRLKKLNVVDNKISTFPIEGDWRSLRKLNVANNFLDNTIPNVMIEFASRNKIKLDVVDGESAAPVNHISNAIPPRLKTEYKWEESSIQGNEGLSSHRSASDVREVEDKRKNLQKSGSFSVGIEGIGNPFKMFQRRSSTSKFVDIPKFDGKGKEKEKTKESGLSNSLFSPRRKGRNRKRSLSSGATVDNNSIPIRNTRSRSHGYTGEYKERKSKRKRLMKSLQKKEELRPTTSEAPMARTSNLLQYTPSYDVASGTIDDLLELLIFDSELRSIEDYQRQFVLVYPSLIDDVDFLEYLFREYDSGCSVVRYRIIDVLSLAVQFHRFRYSKDSENSLQTMVIQFVGAHCTDHDYSQELLAILGHFRCDGKKSDLDDGMPLGEMTPKQVAKQLYIIDHRYFRNIPLHDFLDGRFLKLVGGDSEFRQFSKWFNKLSAYVSSSILQTSLTVERTKLINRFIVTAYKSMEIRDFSASLAIISGLQCASVRRLKASWHNITVKSLNMYNELDELYTMCDNFHNYREHVQSVSSRMIPILAVIERDLIHIEEGNEKFLENSAINFERCAMVAEQLLPIYRYQQCKVPFIEFTHFEDQFSVTILDEDEMWNISKLLEPFDEVKNIPAPVVSKRKALREFGNNFRGDFKNALQDLRETKNEIESNYESFLQSLSPRKKEEPKTPRMPPREFRRSKSLGHTGTDLLRTAIPRNTSAESRGELHAIYKLKKEDRSKKSSSERLASSTIRKTERGSEVAKQRLNRNGSRILPPPVKRESEENLRTRFARQRSLPSREKFLLAPNSFQRIDADGDVFSALLDYANETDLDFGKDPVLVQ